MKVILFSPVRDTPEMVAEMLATHDELEGVAERWYYNDNDNPDSAELLRLSNGHVLPHLPVLREEYRKEDTHVWTRGLTTHMAQVRNHAIAEFLRSEER